MWTNFHKKENGLNGRNSRCECCIRKAKMTARKKKVQKPISANSVDVANCNLVETIASDSKMQNEFEKLLNGLIYDTVFEIDGGKNE